MRDGPDERSGVTDPVGTGVPAAPGERLDAGAWLGLGSPAGRPCPEAEQGLRVTLDAPLPPIEAVTASAARSELARQIQGLVVFLGDGRQLTPSRALTMADARSLVRRVLTGDVVDPVVEGRVHPVRSPDELPGVRRLITAARVARWVRVYRGALVPTKAGRRVGCDPVSDVRHLLGVVLARGPASFRYGGDRTVEGSLAAVFDEMSAPLLVLLLGTARGIAHDEIVDRAFADMDDHLGEVSDPAWTDRFRRQLACTLIDAVLDLFEVVGVVRSTPAPPPAGPLPAGTPRRPARLSSPRAGGSVALTPIGRVLVAELVLRRGIEVVEARHAGSSFAEMMAAMRERPLTEHSRELEAWMAVRSADDAIDELVAFAAVADQPGERFAALNLLGGFATSPLAGDPRRSVTRDVVAAVRGLLEVPGARGAALVWLVDRCGADPGCLLDPDPGVVIDALFYRLVSGGPASVVAVIEHAGRTDAQVALLRRLWRIPSPAVVPVLESVGLMGRDPLVVREARKGLLRHRSWLMADEA
jgi:hypothetical protein